MCFFVPVPPCTARPNGLFKTSTVFVFVDDHLFDRVAVALRDAGRSLQSGARFFRLTHDRGNADFRPGSQAIVGLGALGIDAYLTGPQQLLQISVAHLRKVHAEPAVEPHVGLAVANPDRFYFSRDRHANTQRDTQRPANTANRLKTTEART